MRVGILAPDLLKTHGWGSYSLNLIEQLQALNVETIILSADNSPKNPPIAGKIHPILPSVTPTAPYLALRLLATMPQARDLVADCDVIHSTVEFYAPLATMIAGNRPAVTTIHGSYAYLPQNRRFPINQFFRWAYQKSHLICVSQYTEKVVHRIVPEAQTSVIPNAVDFDRFANLPTLPTPPTSPIVLSSGGVKARKGTLQLVRAIAQVRQYMPDVRCVVIGSLTSEPEYVLQVKAEIERLNVQDHVQLLGMVDDATLLGWYGSADVFALPSINDGWKFEGFGLVHLEASASGLPIIGTTDCGAEDVIDDGVTGLLVNQARVDEELPQALLRLLQNPDEAKRMGATGKARARQQTWLSNAQQVIAIYEHQLRQS